MPAHAEDMEQTFWNAITKRDHSYDGRFYYGVLTTGVYCRPSCGARTPLRKNVRFYATTADAERDGLRPCLRCRPTEDSGRRMEQLRRYIEEHADQRLTLDHLAEKCGMSKFHLQRTFKASTGVSPREYQEAFRMQRLKKSLRESHGVADAVYDAGFGSSSRVYERSTPRLGMTPGEYRAGGRGVEISYARFETNLGPVLIGATDRGICFLQFGASVEDLRREFPRAEIKQTEGPSSQLREWSRAIATFTGGDFPLAPAGTPFQMQVWEFLRTIPRGETRTYAQVAAGIGRPSAARAVAQACASNPVAVLIPCHRVIRGDGDRGGYRWGIKRKRALLDLEGAARQAPRRP